MKLNDRKRQLDEELSVQDKINPHKKRKVLDHDDLLDEFISTIYSQLNEAYEVDLAIGTDIHAPSSRSFDQNENINQDHFESLDITNQQDLDLVM